MKKIIIFTACCLLFAGNALANPFIVCDPQTGVTHYKVTGATWVPATVSAQADGSIKMDVATAPGGTSSLQFKACWSDPVWGEACSANAPFSFTRPGTPNTPAGVKLAP